MATLDEFIEAWIDKPNRDRAYAIAEAFVREHEIRLESMFGGKTSEELAEFCTQARQRGEQEAAWMATIWELVKFPRQTITGRLNVG